MNSRTIIRLTVVLGALVLLWLGQAWWSGRKADQSSGWTKLESGVKKDQVDKIKLEVDNKTLELKKSNDNWMVDEQNANAGKAEKLLDLLDGPLVELVSQNQDRHSELGVADDGANKVSYYKGEEEKFGLLVNKENGQLIRQKGKQNVYKLSSGLELSGNKEDWLEATPSASLSPSPSEE